MSERLPPRATARRSKRAQPEIGNNRDIFHE